MNAWAPGFLDRPKGVYKLAAPFMRWAKVMAGFIHDLVMAVVHHRRIPHSYADRVRDQIRE